MQTKRPQDFRTAFIDVLMNVNTAIIAISVLSFMLIQPLVKKNEGIEKKAEFVATIEWDKTLDCDVDSGCRILMASSLVFSAKILADEYRA
jgi:hypothetical protein